MIINIRSRISEVCIDEASDYGFETDSSNKRWDLTLFDSAGNVVVFNMTRRDLLELTDFIYFQARKEF